MKLSQITFSGYVSVPGVNLRDGFRHDTPGVVSIDFDGNNTVTIVGKDGPALVPWSKVVSAVPMKLEPAKK